MNASKKKFIYPSLNGLRAISILLVIFHHLELRYATLSTHLPIQLKYFYNLLADGHLGVNVFFIISGFLITSLLLTEENSTQKISLKNFYIRRTLRIFPAYYFFLLVLFGLQVVHVIHISAPSWITAITYTKYFNWKLDWYTAHAWSLSIEEHFYLFFPLLFTLGNKLRKSVSFILVLFVPAINLYNHYYPITGLNDLTIFKRIDALAIGCLIAFYKDLLIIRLQQHFRLLFYISMFGIIIIEFLPNISTKWNLHLDFIIMLAGSRHGTIANICIGTILLYSVYGKYGLWYRFLNTQLLNYIGMLSYSIYLWQQLFISEATHWVTTFPQNLLCIILCALFSFYCVEKPFLKLKDKFSIH